MCTLLGDRHYILETGRVVYHGTRDEFAADETAKDRYLGVEAH